MSEINREEITLMGVPNTHLQTELFGNYCHVFISETQVGVCLPESGRAFGSDDAVAQLQALIAFAQQAIDVIEAQTVTVSEQSERQPGSVTRHGQLTTWNRRRLTPKNKQQRIMTEISQIVDVAFNIVPERAKSWREQIVDEEVEKDGAA